MSKFLLTVTPCAASMTPRAVTYELEVVQQPERARASGAAMKFTGRRVIDPPVVVRLIACADGTVVTSSSAEMHFMVARVEPVAACLSGPEPGHPLRTHEHYLGSEETCNSEGTLREPYEIAQEYHVERAPPAVETGATPTPNDDLFGTTCSSLNITPAQAPLDAYFVFPDLSIRRDGTFRLVLTHYSFSAVRGQAVARSAIRTMPFRSYRAKDFPGLESSPEVIRQISALGSKVRVRNVAEPARPNVLPESRARTLEVAPSVVPRAQTLHQTARGKKVEAFVEALSVGTGGLGLALVVVSRSHTGKGVANPPHPAPTTPHLLSRESSESEDHSDFSEPSGGYERGVQAYRSKRARANTQAAAVVTDQAKRSRVDQSVRIHQPSKGSGKGAVVAHGQAQGYPQSLAPPNGYPDGLGEGQVYEPASAFHMPGRSDIYGTDTPVYGDANTADTSSVASSQDLYNFYTALEHSHTLEHHLDSHPHLAYSSDYGLGFFDDLLGLESSAYPPTMQMLHSNMSGLFERGPDYQQRVLDSFRDPRPEGWGELGAHDAKEVQPPLGDPHFMKHQLTNRLWNDTEPLVYLAPAPSMPMAKPEFMGALMPSVVYHPPLVHFSPITPQAHSMAPQIYEPAVGPMSLAYDMPPPFFLDTALVVLGGIAPCLSGAHSYALPYTEIQSPRGSKDEALKVYLFHNGLIG